MQGFLELFRKKDLSPLGWRNVLKNLSREFLHEYYSLPANEETLSTFLEQGVPPDGYFNLCRKYSPIARAIQPILKTEGERLWLRERETTKRDVGVEYRGSRFEASTQRSCLDAFCKLLENQTAPTALLIDRQLRDLYRKLPDMSLPDGYNPVHDFYWKGTFLKGDRKDEEVFLIRELPESCLPYPTRESVLIPEEGRGGYPLPHSSPEVRYRKGKFRSEDYYDISIHIWFLYWLELCIKAYSKESFHHPVGQVTRPIQQGYFSAHEDPALFLDNLYKFAALLDRAYESIRHQLPVTCTNDKANLTPPYPLCCLPRKSISLLSADTNGPKGQGPKAPPPSAPDAPQPTDK